MEVRKGSKAVVIAYITLLTALWLTACTSAPVAGTASVTAGVPPLPELQFSQMPPAERANYEGDRFRHMESGPKSAPWSGKM